MRKEKSLRSVMAMLLALCLCLAALAGCEQKGGDAQDASDKKTEEKADSNEEYVLVSVQTTMPLFMDHEYKAFEAWGKARGVKTSIVGPTEWDVAEQVTSLEQVIASKPAGILCNGSDPQIAVAVNSAVKAGIPIITFDGEVPGAEPLGHIGSDWYEVGVAQARSMAELIGEKGEVAMIGVVGLQNQSQGFQGFTDTMEKEYPDIKIVGTFTDNATVEGAAEATNNIMSAYPDIAGIAGFASVSGPGIGQAVKEADKVGKIKITCVDGQPEHLDLVKSDVISKLIVQKRELFGWLGGQYLYDYVHNNIPLTKDDKQAGVTCIPRNTNTGYIEVTKDNVDLFIENYDK